MHDDAAGLRAGTSGLTRRALSIAVHHTAQRRAFGKRLIEQPLMQNVLADLAIESEAALALSMRLARAFDHPHDEQERLLAGVLTPIAKFWICKRGSHFALDAMAGAAMATWKRAATESWCASTARCRSTRSGKAPATSWRWTYCARCARPTPPRRLPTNSRRPRGAHSSLDRLSSSLPLRVEEMATEMEARRLAQDVALAVQATLLYRTAPAAVFAAFCDSRLAGHWGEAFATLAAGTDFDTILQRAMPLAWMHDLILHHYRSAPFSEKVRLILGYKKLQWKSVLIPAIIPKPDLVALTGGYRRTTVLQVGADLYCDTALICDVLQHVRPEPTRYPPHLKGACRTFAQWDDPTLF